MKKINYISDLHSNFFLGYNKNVISDDGILKENFKSDYLIIAGDTSDNIAEVKMTLDLFIRYKNYKKIILTFGNHDLRMRQKDHNKYGIKNSIEKYIYLINHFHGYANGIVHVIDKENLIIDEYKLIITGNMGWYNYSGVKEMDREYLSFLGADFDKMMFKGTGSNDKTYIKFNEEITGNIQFAEYLENNLISRLENIKNNPELKDYELLGISHIKPSIFLEQNSPYYSNYSKDDWEEILHIPFLQKNLGSLYMNAFYTNNNLHEIYKKYGVKYVVYGHTHMKDEYELDGIKYFTNSFGYYDEGVVSKNICSINIV